MSTEPEKSVPAAADADAAPETPKKKKKDKTKSTDGGGDDVPKSSKPRKDDENEALVKSPKEKKTKKKKEKSSTEEDEQAEDVAIENSPSAAAELSPKKLKKKVSKEKTKKSPKSKKKESVTAADADEPGEETVKVEKKEKKKKKDKSKDDKVTEENVEGEGSDDAKVEETSEPVEAEAVAEGETMKAWQLAGYNPDVHAAVDSLTLVDVLMPTISDEDQVLVKVSYAALNPIDYKLFTGGFHGACPIDKFPYTPGFDVAGTIAAVGSKVKNLKVGDKIITDIGLLESCKSPPLKQGAAGAFAEYSIVPQNLVVACNEVGDLKTVAGLPLAGLTVYQALFTGNNKSLVTKNPLGSLEKDQKVLILAGASATGSLAIQMAKAKGATVATTASSTSKINDDSMTKMEFCKSLGADIVIDYTTQDWAEELKDQEFDMILDCVGQPEDPAKAGKILKPGGLLVSIANFAMEGKCDGIRYEGMLLRSNAEDLKKILDMVESGKVKVPIDSVFKFAELQDAMNRQTSGKASGKVILAVSSD